MKNNIQNTHRTSGVLILIHIIISQTLLHITSHTKTNKTCSWFSADANEESSGFVFGWRKSTSQVCKDVRVNKHRETLKVMKSSVMSYKHVCFSLSALIVCVLFLHMYSSKALYWKYNNDLSTCWGVRVKQQLCVTSQRNTKHHETNRRHVNKLQFNDPSEETGLCSVLFFWL